MPSRKSKKIAWASVLTLMVVPYGALILYLEEVYEDRAHPNSAIVSVQGLALALIAFIAVIVMQILLYGWIDRKFIKS